MANLRRCSVAFATIQEFVRSNPVCFSHFENCDIAYQYQFFAEDLGSIEASRPVPPNDLVVIPCSTYVVPGGEAKFRITTRMTLNEYLRPSVVYLREGVSRVIHTHATLAFHKQDVLLPYSVGICDLSPAKGDLVELVVPVPSDAPLRSEVVLRRVIVAGFDVATGEFPCSIAVGIFNHNLALADRVYSASRAGDLPALQRALDDGCSTQEADANGNMPLHFAANLGHDDVIRLLLEVGAPASTPNKNGITPLHVAVYSGQVDAVSQLLSAGAPASPIDKAGNTPLYIAADNGHINIVNLLLDAGASPSLKNESEVCVQVYCEGK